MTAIGMRHGMPVTIAAAWPRFLYVALGDTHRFWFAALVTRKDHGVEPGISIYLSFPEFYRGTIAGRLR